MTLTPKISSDQGSIAGSTYVQLFEELEIYQWRKSILDPFLEASNVFHQTPWNTGYISSMLETATTPSG